jgi:hypothetical protein
MASRGRLWVQATPAADRAIRDLRGTTAKRYVQFEDELRAQGCAVAGYRLLAPERGDLSDYCCKHLDRRWRIGTQREAKPPCCGDGGWPSVGLAERRSGH